MLVAALLTVSITPKSFMQTFLKCYIFSEMGLIILHDRISLLIARRSARRSLHHQMLFDNCHDNKKKERHCTFHARLCHSGSGIIQLSKHVKKEKMRVYKHSEAITSKNPCRTSASEVMCADISEQVNS